MPHIDLLLLSHPRRNPRLIVLQITPQPLRRKRRPHNELQHAGAVLLDLGVAGEEGLERWGKGVDCGGVVEEEDLGCVRVKRFWMGEAMGAYGSVSSPEQPDTRHEEVDEICGRGEGSDVCCVVPERGVVGAEEDDAAGAADVDYVFLSSCKAICFLPSSIAS